MANLHKPLLLADLQARFGRLRALPESRSLFVVGDEAARIYVRYSRVHGNGRTFFGWRRTDLNQLVGFNSFICLLTDQGEAPIFVTYADFEHAFDAATPANDGQYKVQLSSWDATHELYIAGMGWFNVDGYVGIDRIALSFAASRLRPSVNSLQHCQVQTLIASIGAMKGCDVYIPPNNRESLDWAICEPFRVAERLPACFDSILSILGEVDVLWVAKGSHELTGLFEVEHSTPVYSGLLRFNDVLLTNPAVSRYFIVSNDTRRDLFARQAARPTFRRSGLSELASFMEYANIVDWYERLKREKNGRT